jgi:hypothetical protein
MMLHALNIGQAELSPHRERLQFHSGSIDSSVRVRLPPCKPPGPVAARSRAPIRLQCGAANRYSATYPKSRATNSSRLARRRALTQWHELVEHLSCLAEWATAHGRDNVAVKQGARCRASARDCVGRRGRVMLPSVKRGGKFGQADKNEDGTGIACCRCNQGGDRSFASHASICRRPHSRRNGQELGCQLASAHARSSQGDRWRSRPIRLELILRTIHRLFAAGGPATTSVHGEIPGGAGTEDSALLWRFFCLPR